MAEKDESPFPVNFFDDEEEGDFPTGDEDDDFPLVEGPDDVSYGDIMSMHGPSAMDDEFEEVGLLSRICSCLSVIIFGFSCVVFGPVHSITRCKHILDEQTDQWINFAAVSSVSFLLTGYWIGSSCLMWVGGAIYSVGSLAILWYSWRGK